MMRAFFSIMAAAIFAVAIAAGGAVGPARAQDAYHLGEGDVVRLTVYQRPDLSAEARLGADGRLYVPGGGKLDLGGLTIPEAEAQIAQLLSHSGAAPNPQVDLQVTTFGSQKISVFGYVRAPGAYALDRPTHMSELLALAGGIIPDQGSDHVILLRKSDNNTETRTIVNMKDIIQGGNSAADVLVKGGDIVNVPRAARVYVYGSVNRPGPYNLEDGMTALEVISLAGGLSATGSDGRLEVVRHGDAGKVQSLKVGLQDKLQPEDVLIVHESIF